MEPLDFGVTPCCLVLAVLVAAQTRQEPEAKAAMEPMVVAVVVVVVDLLVVLAVMVVWPVLIFGGFHNGLFSLPNK
jgi:hypothetical protein